MKFGLRRSRGRSPSASGTERLPDYQSYVLSGRQTMLCLTAGGALFYAVGYIFFHSWLLALLLAGAAAFVPKPWSRFLLRRRREALSLDFKQALYSLSSSLAAGRSVENGFREAIQDLRLLYPDGKNDLMIELGIICTRMEYGEPIEDALQDFSRRADMEDISNFADVFTTCKRSGGDLVEVVRRTSSILSEKLEISQEISVMIAQKRFEAKAMLASPVLFLLFMDLTSPDYMRPLHQGAGLVISAAALLLFALCSWIMMRIMDIRV
ncbi:type II secretion system F family protein [Paenibacillus ihumii]|uniref:type II secretion system F family protein n=1 Tax=Paenibacillus ihumii TaxID=687436 RepID=UPI0006D83775|nr:type II secretion system F family protein [Paenibacillus ihumii]